MANQQNQQNQQERVYYSKVNILKRGKDQPLNEAVYTVSGEVSYAEKKAGQYGDYLAVTLTAVLGDKFVERNFGAEFVNPEHKVEFRFNLNGVSAQNFVEHPPRWGQDILFMLYDMKPEEFQRRSGETGRNISAKCSGFAALGSLKKPDGSDRPAIRIRGIEDGTSAPAAAAPAAAANRSVQEAMSSMNVDTLEDDGELPF